MLKKIKDWIGTNLDVYKVETANDVGAGLVRHIWKGEETATQVGTTLSAQVMNDLQKGLVHTLDTIRTVGTNKDIYEVALTGIEEFGVFDGLKLLIRIDGENQFEDVFLKLGGAEYQIYQLKNNMLDKIDKGILKDKKEYLLNFKNNSFVLSDSTLYGSQKGTALEGNRLAEILGLQFGGNIQDIGNKTKGKFYYDNVMKFYYECIEDNSLTYNDSGKFRAISNKPLLDKVENLLGFKTTNFNARNFNGSHKCNSKTFLIGIHMNAISNQGNTKFSDIKWIPNLNGEWYTTQIFDNFVNSEGFKISNKNGELKISYIDASNSGVNLIAIYEIFLN